MVGAAQPLWPLARQPKQWTAGGSFGASRDGGSRLHQGVDLYAPASTPVLASEDGEVIGLQGWSGPKTKGLLVYSPATDITILYGAVAPNSTPLVGSKVRRGEQIATIGVYPAGSTMLHLEVWPGRLSIPRPRWNPGQDPPSYDPAPYLERAWDHWTTVPGLIPQADGQNTPVDPPKGGSSSSSSGSGAAGLALAAAAAYFLFK